MGRAPCCDKANVKKGPWSPEEDTKLKDFIHKHGIAGNWISLPQKAGLKRCGKSCRLRWLNYLRPNIKHGEFSEEEDTIICNLYAAIGSRWSVIAAHLPGRTDNDIKNYWNTKLKKKLLATLQPKSAASPFSFPQSQTLYNSLNYHTKNLTPTPQSFVNYNYTYNQEGLMDLQHQYYPYSLWGGTEAASCSSTSDGSGSQLSSYAGNKREGEYCYSQQQCFRMINDNDHTSTSAHLDNQLNYHLEEVKGLVNNSNSTNLVFCSDEDVDRGVMYYY